MTLPRICRALFHPVIVKPKSAPYYCFPELPSSCSLAPLHTSPFTTATLAEPFHPSSLKSSAGSLYITSVALSTALRFPSPGVTLAKLMPYNSCCGLPAYLSISHVKYILENFCPQTMEICAELSSQQGETITPVISVNRQRTRKVCEADKAYTKHFFTEVLLSLQMF